MPQSGIGEERAAGVAQVVPVLAAGTEQLAEEQVVDIDQGRLEVSHGRQRVQALLPSRGEEVRLDVGELEPAGLSPLFQQGVLLAQDSGTSSTMSMASVERIR